MVKNFMAEKTDAKGFRCDGFPRTIAQAEALDSMLTDFNTEISIVLGLEVNEDELVTRLLLRGRTSGRADDQSEDTIRNRFQEYLNKTLPIQNYYLAKNKYFGVEGIGEIEQIFESLCDHLDKIF